ncbi:TonB-dependent receptor [Phenylobacterium sp.]|uniref:TonB-dependent receptor n=1 Tax=Phenylobacterium sp. TaxID=1871053 RepID=UPI002F3F92B3
MEEVVVTAQRRSQNLQDVPISVTALEGADLAAKGVVSTQDLTLAVPGLLWARSTNFNQPTIRGVGSRNASPGDEPNVAVFFDGVYQPDQFGTLFELSNIERIEVLKGPQGTLFGRNATGGAINVITAAPSFTPKGSFSATYGRFDYRKGSAYLSGPIIADKLAASVSAMAFADDGYIHNIYLNTTQGKYTGRAVRGKLLFTPTDDLKLQLNGLYTRSFNNVLTSPYVLNGNTQARSSATSNFLNPTHVPLSQIVADQPYTTATGIVPIGKVSLKMLDAHMDWDLGWAALSALASVGSTNGQNLSLSEGSPLLLSQTYYYNKTNDTTQELVLTSGPGALTWLVGAQGFQARAAFSPIISTSRSATTGLFTVTPTIGPQNTRAVAGFAEATWNPLERLFLTGGLRYNWESKEASSITAAGVVTAHAKATFHNLSPRAVVRYQFADNSNVYASFSKGYKSGVYSITSSPLPIRPEKISAYEVGLKTDIGPRIRLNAAAYHYDYTDLQVAAFVTVNGASRSILQNAGNVKINGFEAGLEAKVTSELSVNAGLSLLKTKINDFPNASINVPRATAGVPDNTGNVTLIANIDGNELARAPKATLSLGATYTHELLGGDLTLNGGIFFSSKYFAELGDRVVQPSYEVLNASATWREPDGHYYVTVFGQNLTNQVYAAGHLITAFADATQVSKPRWAGVTVGYDF